MLIYIYPVYLKQHVVGLNIIKFQRANLQIDLHLMNNLLIVHMLYVLLMKQENIGKNQQVEKQKLMKKFVQLRIQHLIIVGQLRKKMQKKLLKLMRNINQQQRNLIRVFINLPMFEMKKNDQRKKKNFNPVIVIDKCFSSYKNSYIFSCLCNTFLLNITFE